MIDNASEAMPHMQRLQYEPDTVEPYIPANVEDTDQKRPNTHDMTPSYADWEVIWEQMDKLVEELDKHWPEGVSVVNAVSKQRRDL